MSVLIVDGFVPGGVIVPDGDVARLTADLGLEFGLLAMGAEHRKERGGCGQVYDMSGEDRVHVETAAVAEEVDDDHRVA